MVKTRTRGFTLGVGLLLACTTAIPAVQAETLADAMVKAYNSSPELAVGRANVRVLGEQAVQERALGRIQVDGNVDLDFEFDELERAEYPTSLSLDVVQPLYTGGQVQNNTEAAETRITAEESRLLATEQVILLNTVIAYADVRQNETLVELGENNVRVLNEQLRAAQERFEVGEVTRTDVAQAEARLEAARSGLAASRGALENAREAYKRVVSDYPGDLTPLPPLPDLPASVDEAVSIAMQSEPDIIAARLERQAASSDVRAAIGTLLPQVDLIGQLRRQDRLAFENDSESDATVGIRINIPFYTGGFNYSNVREAQANAEGAGADINIAIRDAAQETGDAWADLQVARASIKAGRLEITAAEIAFEGVQEEAKVGARTTLDVLDAEQELLDARGDLVTSRRDEYVAAYTLLFAIGKLTVEHLGLDVDNVQPAGSHYASVRERNFGYDRTDDTVWTRSYRP